MDIVNICCINDKIYQKIKYDSIIDLSNQLKSVIDNNCELFIKLTLNNIVLNKFNIINNSVLSKLIDTDVIRIIFNEEELLLDCVNINLKDDKNNILEGVKNDVDILLHISDDLKNDREFILSCIKIHVKSLLYAGDNLKNDKEFILMCIRICW